MRPRRNPVPRAKDSWVWLGGLLLLGILGAGVTAAAVVLWENVDIRQIAPELAEAPPSPPVPVAGAPRAHPGDGFDVAVFVSPRNAGYFPDGTWYDRSVDAWAAVAVRLGGDVRSVRSAEEIEAMAPGEVLLVPEAPCLTGAEFQAIRGHARGGGGVVANWALGARDGSCEWIGWGALAALTEAEDVREVSGREALFLTVPGGVALSPGLDPGSRIELRPDPSLALRIDGARVFWSDWALNPFPDESGGGADVAAATLRNERGGRVAWFGFRLGQAATAADSVKMARLVENGLLWAAELPMAALAPWPRGNRAALMLTLDVESRARNALDAAAYLAGIGMPATFFAVSQLVEGDDELAEALLSAGEVGSQTTDHKPVAGLTAQDQGIRLRRSRGDIEAWTGIPAAGLRPPLETFDELTVRAWDAAGGGYILAVNEGRSASPELHRTGRGQRTLPVLPRLLKDDHNVYVQEGADDDALLAEAWLDGIAKLRSLGGLAVVAGHTQIMNSDDRLAAWGAVADTARAQGDWWIATGSEVADWWKGRARARLTFVPSLPDAGPLGEGVEPSGLPDLLVEAPVEAGTPDGLWVDVVLPRSPEGLVPWVDDQPAGYAVTPWGLRVPVGPLPPGGVRRIRMLIVDEGVSGSGS